MARSGHDSVVVTQLSASLHRAAGHGALDSYVVSLTQSVGCLERDEHPFSCSLKLEGIMVVIPAPPLTQNKEVRRSNEGWMRVATILLRVPLSIPE